MQDNVPHRPNRFEIDLGAIAHNLAEVRRLTGPDVRIITALKADAYGFGLGPVAETVVAGGASAIAVADLADAAKLRERGFDAPILLYAGHVTDAVTVAAVESNRVMPTIFDEPSAHVYSSCAQAPIRVFVKIDVGLERLGVVPERAAALVRLVRDLPKLEVEGLYTHVDVPESPRADDYVAWQLQRYYGVCDELAGQGITVPIRMVASSAVLRCAPHASHDAVDPGHLLFGLTPPGPVKVGLNLKRAFASLSSRLIHERRLERAEFQDLAPFQPAEGMRFGVIPFGLRDGMASLTCGEVLVRGRRVPILGAVSLEHTRVDLTRVPAARIGDEVVIIGRQGSAAIEPEEVSEHQGFGVKAELALAVRGSVPRVYV